MGVTLMCIFQAGRINRLDNIIIELLDEIDEFNSGCLHCGENKADYCEKCYQDLLSKNIKLQREVHTYQEAVKEIDEKIRIID